ncbi:MAG: AI-2E family transporter [Prolixibacteraceae bacterium]
MNLTKIIKILLLVLIVFFFLYVGSSFLIPFIFGIFFALLMAPLSNFLERAKLRRTIASLISTLVVFVIAGSFLFLFIYQMNEFVSNINMIREELQSFLQSIQKQIESLTSLTTEDQNKIWEQRSEQWIKNTETILTDLFGNILHTLVNFLLVLVYMFLLLLYREKISDFIMMYTRKEKKERIRKILYKIRKVVNHYLLGRVKVMFILGVMYYITFLIFDLPYAILLTIFGALITIIPYIGPLVSGTLPILFSMIFFDDIQKILLFSAIIVIEQLIESYVLEPLILGKEVQLNPLVVIIAVIVGGMFWGLAGMILFVPLFAMFKIISNNSPGLEPVGFLLGSHQKSDEKSQ